LSTDLHCITSGFGLIQLLGAEEAGWQGYLHQETRVHALALFVAVQELPIECALDFLPRHLIKGFRRALKELDRQEVDLTKLRTAMRAK
jgi:hypothetical protein